MAVPTVPAHSLASEISDLLDSPEIAALIGDLEALRWTGRKGYPIRSLVGACLAKSMYGIPTWTRVAALIAEHAALREALGGAPSVYACYRFSAKLREHRPLLDACLDGVTASLRAELPEYGRDLATDASDMPAFANGQRFVAQGWPGARAVRSDPDASWGHRSAVSTRAAGSFYGYKLHQAVCARTELPVAWRVETARIHEASLADELLQRVHERKFQPERATMDLGYDTQPIHDACHEAGCLRVIPLKKTTAVVQGKHKPPTCEHGEWTFAGGDFKRRLTKWRCPAGECRAKVDLAEGFPPPPCSFTLQQAVRRPLPRTRGR